MCAYVNPVRRASLETTQLLPGTPRGSAGPPSPPIIVVHTRLIDHERCPPGQYTRGLSYLVQTLAEGRERGGRRRREAGDSPRAGAGVAAAGGDAVGRSPRLSFGDQRAGRRGRPGASSGGVEVCRGLRGFAEGSSPSFHLMFAALVCVLARTQRIYALDVAVVLRWALLAQPRARGGWGGWATRATRSDRYRFGGQSWESAHEGRQGLAACSWSPAAPRRRRRRE